MNRWAILCRPPGWVSDANLCRQLDPQVSGLYGFAKADAQTTLPAKVPPNIKNTKLLREACHSLLATTMQLRKRRNVARGTAFSARRFYVNTPD